MISTITLNPSVDKTVYVNKLVTNDTNRVLKVEVDAGGKGINSARMLQRLGTETQIISFLGGESGEFIKSELERESIHLQYIPTQKPTPTCIAIKEQGGLAPTTLNELGGPVEHAELVGFLELVKDAASKSNYMALGGSVPLGVNQDVYNVIIQMCAVKGCKSILDADGDSLHHGIKARPFMIKPNKAEAQRLLQRTFTSKNDVGLAALELSDRGIPLVVISLGKQGAVAAFEQHVYDVIAPKVKAISTIGSGDSFVAGVIAGLENGKDIEEALSLGAAAGAATAMSDSTQIGTKEDVERLLADVKVHRSK